MNIPLQLLSETLPLPDHTQLPDKDGIPVKNAQDPLQSYLLTDSLQPQLERLHPDGHYFVGADNGIYWLPTEPPMLGCKSPDWYYVPGVPPLPPGQFRRSYVLWREVIAPLLVIEYVSDEGTEERDRTPQRGKFWVYEQGIRIPYYAIYESIPGRVEVNQLVRGRYQPLPPNERGHFPIEELGVELGIWQGVYLNMDVPWLRWWDTQGNLLLTGKERARQEADRAREAADRAERLAARLRELGVDPDQV